MGVDSRARECTTLARERRDIRFSTAASVIAMSAALGWSTRASAATDGNCIPISVSPGSVVHCTDTNNIFYDIEDLTIVVDKSSIRNGNGPGIALIGSIGFDRPSPQYSTEVIDVSDDSSMLTYGDFGYYDTYNHRFPSHNYGIGVINEGYGSNVGIDLNSAAKIHTEGLQGIGINATAFSYIDYRHNPEFDSAALSAKTSISNTGEIDTVGNKAAGISAHALVTARGGRYADAHATAKLRNDGAVKTRGVLAEALMAHVEAYAYGMFTKAHGFVMVNNTGALKTEGNYSGAIEAFSYTRAYGNTASAHGQAYVLNTGDIQVKGEGRGNDGIYAIARVIAAGTRPHTGVNSEADGTTYVYNSKGISIGTGNMSRAIHAASYVRAAARDKASATALTNVANSGQLSNAGYGTVAHYGDGTIRFYGADGIDAYSFAAAHVSDYDAGTSTAGAATLVHNSGAIVTSGDYGRGIEARAVVAGSNGEGDALATITNSGSITTYNLFSDGLYAFARAQGAKATATVQITNSGEVLVYGHGDPGPHHHGTLFYTSDGIYAVDIASAQAYGSAPMMAKGYAATTVRNTANITTGADNSAGIDSFARSISQGLAGAYAKSSSDIENGGPEGSGGEIATSGDGADGIRIVNAGVALSPDSYDQITASVAMVVSHIDNLASISTTGLRAYDLYANTMASSTGYAAGAYATTAIDTGYDLYTAGTGAIGVYGVATATTNGYYTAVAQADTTIGSDADVNTAGDRADGLEAVATAKGDSAVTMYGYSAATVKNRGSVTTYGRFANAIVARAAVLPASGNQPTAEARATANNSGTILTGQDDSSGIVGISLAEAIFNSANGDTMTADAGTHLDNSGMLTISGQYAAGMLADSVATADAFIPGSASDFDSEFGILLGPSAVSGSGKTATAHAGTDIENHAQIKNNGAKFAPGIAGDAAAAAHATDTAHAVAGVTFANSAGISTAGEMSPGVMLQAVANVQSGLHANAETSLAATNTGDISTVADHSDGLVLTARSGSAGSQDAHATATGQLTSTAAISTAGDYSGGIVLLSAASSQSDKAFASAISTFNGADSIATLGDHAAAVDVRSYDTVAGIRSGTVSAASYMTNSADLTTAGNHSDGLYTHIANSATGDSDRANALSMFTNSGSVSTAGDYSAALMDIMHASAAQGLNSVAGSSLTLDNSGAIVTEGFGADGILAHNTSYAFSSAAAQANVVTTVHNHAAVKTSKADADAVFGYSWAYVDGVTVGKAYSTVTVDNTMEVDTMGDYSRGVIIEAYANGYGATAIGTATAILTNSGDVTTYGKASGGLVGRVAPVLKGDGTETATLTVNNSGEIVTSGDASDGIDLRARGATSGGPAVTGVSTVTLTNSGAIRTAGAGSDGIFLRSRVTPGTAPDASSTSSLGANNSGAIATSGDRASGLIALSLAQAMHSDGNAASQADATSTMNLVNSAQVSTAGSYSAGLFGISAASASALLPSELEEVAGAFGATLGESDPGINYGGTSTAVANLVLSNIATIATSGDKFAPGIDLLATAAADSLVAKANSGVTLTNSGDIATTGDLSAGIDVRSGALSLGNSAGATTKSSILNDGEIDSGGSGILLSGYATTRGFLASASTSLNLKNTGRVMTGGDNARALLVDATAQVLPGQLGAKRATAASKAGLVNSGDLTAWGDNAFGLLVNSDASGIGDGIGQPTNTKVSANASTRNTGNIDASGAGSNGIGTRASVTGAAVGTVDTKGSGKAVTGSAQITGTAAVSVKNSGAIHTSGGGIVMLATSDVRSSSRVSIASSAVPPLSVGAAASTTSTAKVSLTNLGDIFASSDGIYALAISSALADASISPSDLIVDSVYSITSDATAKSTINIKNAGTIIASGDGIEAIGRSSASGDTSYGAINISITNHGSIGSSGTRGISAVALVSSDGPAARSSSKIAIVSSGDIAMSGLNATGIYGSGGDVSIVISGGSIEGGGGTGSAIATAASHKTTLVNSGDLAAASDHVLSLVSGDANTVTNRGTMTGTILLSAHSNKMTNAGLWIAEGGDSDFTTTDGSSIFVNSPAAQIIVVGDQNWQGLTRFTDLGFLLLNAGSGHAGLSGPTFETLAISGDFVGGGVVGLDVDLGSGAPGTAHGDRLSIAGNVSGTTKLALSLGGNSATSGNGVLLVDVGGTSGATSFLLQGDTADGKLVVGLNQFNLSLVNGGGTLGGSGWYLQSTIYPGAYQYPALGASALGLTGQAGLSFDDLSSLAPPGSGSSASNPQFEKLASADNSIIPLVPLRQHDIGIWARHTLTGATMSPNGAPNSFYLQSNVTQFGIDYAAGVDGGTLLGGVEFGPASATLTFDSGASHARVSGSMFGAYGLWLRGAWVFGVLGNLSGRITGQFDDPITGTQARFSSHAGGVQAAASYEMDFDNDLFLVPRSVFSWQHADGFDFVDATATHIFVSPVDSVVATIGAKFGERFSGSNDRLYQPYLNLSLNQEFNGRVTTTAAGSALSTDMKGSNVELGIGILAQFGPNVSLSANANYLTGTTQRGFKTDIELRFLP